jgi:WD40 repeat protein
LAEEAGPQPATAPKVTASATADVAAYPVDAAVLAVAFSPRGKILATAGNENGEIRLRNVKSNGKILAPTQFGAQPSCGPAHRQARLTGANPVPWAKTWGGTGGAPASVPH